MKTATCICAAGFLMLLAWGCAKAKEHEVLAVLFP
jgi:hypothetical protein